MEIYTAVSVTFSSKKLQRNGKNELQITFAKKIIVTSKSTETDINTNIHLFLHYGEYFDDKLKKTYKDTKF